MAVTVDLCWCGAILVPLGAELREEIERKMEKAQEPPPAKAPKALPKPDDIPRKKRGGKR